MLTRRVPSSVCPIVTSVYCGKTADSIETPFGVVGVVDPRNRVLAGSARGRHLVNTVERLCAAAVSVSATRGGDAACSQITLGDLVSIVQDPCRLAGCYRFSSHHPTESTVLWRRCRQCELVISHTKISYETCICDGEYRARRCFVRPVFLHEITRNPRSRCGSIAPALLGREQWGPEVSEGDPRKNFVICTNMQFLT